MTKTPMYKDLAKYYDLIYSWKDYKKEVAKIKTLIKKYKQSDGIDLLEVACGTGKHAQYLKNDFSILATDINLDMLHFAKKNVSGVTFKQADMIDLNLNKKFDIIVCLFSSIGYVKTYKNLSSVIKNFSHHLKDGGVVIIEPWFTESTYKNGSPTMTSYNGENIKIARLCVAKKRGILSVMDLHYLIAERNQDLEHVIERHELAMFDVNRVLELMKKHGLNARFLKSGLMKGKGLYVGSRVCGVN